MRKEAVKDVLLPGLVHSVTDSIHHCLNATHSRVKDRQRTINHPAGKVFGCKLMSPLGRYVFRTMKEAGLIRPKIWTQMFPGSLVLRSLVPSTAGSWIWPESPAPVSVSINKIHSVHLVSYFSTVVPSTCFDWMYFAWHHFLLRQLSTCQC